MRKHLVLIKLGGGLITDKSKPRVAQKQYIKLFANELYKVRQELEETDFIVGNGAGSFGHFTAHEYGLRDGAHDNKQLYGMCITHNAVRHLSLMVADELTAKHIPAFAMSPASMFTYSNGQAANANLKPVKHLLANRCVPVVHGDTICDDVRGTTIVSTEEVLYTCMHTLRPDYQRITVVYLLSVEGVLDKNGSVIPKLGPKKRIREHASFEHDVTGGITGKIKSARKAAQEADAVYLVSGATPGTLRQALAGGNVGTKIVV